MTTVPGQPSTKATTTEEHQHNRSSMTSMDCSDTDGGDAMSKSAVSLSVVPTYGASGRHDRRDNGPWDLPAGAEMIIKQMAAERIFLEIVDCVMDDTRNPDYRQLTYLLHEFPGLCHRKYEIKWENDGRRNLYPLSILCCLQPPLELLKFVYQVFPSALTDTEAVKGTMAFHYACTFQASLDVVEWMMELDRKLLNTPRKDGMYALHLAVFFKAPPEVVDRLMNAWPEGLVLDYTGEWSLLHAAAAGKADISLVRKLYEANPQSITCLDERRRTPLHQACWKRGNPEVVAFLLEKGPQVLYMEDDQGDTPMFRAVRNQSLEVVRLLLPDDPPLDDMGATLLHFATLDNTVDVVDFLLEEHPNMAVMHTQERDRYTPLHSACHFSNDLATVQTLVRHNPSLVNTVNGHGKTPLETAREFSSSKEIVEFMESVTPCAKNLQNS